MGNAEYMGAQVVALLPLQLLVVPPRLVVRLLLRRRRRRRKRRRRSRTRTWVSVSSTKRAAPITPTPTTSSPKFDLMHFTMVGVTHSGCMLSCRFGHEVLKHGMREEGK